MKNQQAAVQRDSAERVFPPITRDELNSLQVNIGYRCNQACHHCHVDAGPLRTEMMDIATIDVVLEFIARRRIETVDITGGAPELHPHFRDLVCGARARGAQVLDRCNLTVFGEPGQQTTPAFLAEQGVKVVASLPCYSADNVERQRGKGVFEASLAGMRLLNELGYGIADSGLELDLVYNPVGTHLPPDPAALAEDYRRELARHNVFFNRLLTITNMPIKRFRHDLERRGVLADYMTMLHDAFQEANLAHVMCRSLLSVDWRGYVYDCDFNQMLALPAGGREVHLRDLLEVDLRGRPIAVASHCFGCTAGRGSSCSGSLSG
jgi:radical SAM/Cys-rich protein